MCLCLFSHRYILEFDCPFFQRHARTSFIMMIMMIMIIIIVIIIVIIIIMTFCRSACGAAGACKSGRRPRPRPRMSLIACLSRSLVSLSLSLSSLVSRLSTGHMPALAAHARSGRNSSATLRTTTPLSEEAASALNGNNAFNKKMETLRARGFACVSDFLIFLSSRSTSASYGGERESEKHVCIYIYIYIYIYIIHYYYTLLSPGGARSASRRHTRLSDARYIIEYNII